MTTNTDRTPVGLPTCALCSVLACACAAPETPKPGDATAEMLLPAGFPESDAQLRYAVMWTETPGPRVRISDEGPVEADVFEVQLDLPRRVSLERLDPVEDVLLFRRTEYEVTAGGELVEPTFITAPGYRPRVVVYADVDADGELGVDEERSTTDRILAADFTLGFAALLDPEAALRSLTLEQSTRFYEMNTAFTRFIFGSASGGTIFMRPPESVPLLPEPHAQLYEQLLCGRDRVSRGSEDEGSMISVDDALDLEDVCGDLSAECENRDLDELELPQTSGDLDVTRRAQCTQGARTEALLITEGREQCNDCSCITRGTTKVYVAVRDDLPGWWPCGADVAYCRSTGSLTFFNNRCTPEPLGDAGAPDASIPRGAADAGTAVSPSPDVQDAGDAAPGDAG